MTANQNDQSSVLHSKSSARFKLPRAFFIIALLALLLLPVYTALRGLNFGVNGDESYLVDSLSNSVKSGTLLPTYYYYPGAYYTVGVLGMVPYALRYVSTEFDSKVPLRDAVDKLVTDFANVVRADDFRLYLRGVFAIVSYLALLWVLLLVWRWQRNIIEALLAAALLAGSWELNYHTRYLTPDALMMQFGVFTVMALVFAHRAQRPERVRLWQYVAAAAAAQVCGAKYQGGVFLVPVYLSIIFMSSGRFPWRRLLMATLIFGVSFLVTTPGAVLQPLTFAKQVQFQIFHYAGGHGAHTVNAGLDHFNLILGYLGLVVLSKSTLVSAVLGGFVLVGIYSIWKQDRRLGLVFLSPLVLYILIMSIQRVMFIRNLVVLFPFVAILAARGAFYGYRELRDRIRLDMRGTLDLAAGCVMLAAILFNSAILVQAAENIVNPPSVDQVSEVAQYIDAHPQIRFFVSTKVQNELIAYDQKSRVNITSIQGDGEQALFYAGELADVLAGSERRIPINRYQRFIFFSSAFDRVNPNYFDLDPRRIVGLSRDELRSLNVALP